MGQQSKAGADEGEDMPHTMDPSARERADRVHGQRAARGHKPPGAAEGTGEREAVKYLRFVWSSTRAYCGLWRIRIFFHRLFGRDEGTTRGLWLYFRKKEKK